MLAVLQARMSSTRLPGKVMREILGEPMIGRQIERLRRARRLDRIVLATSTGPEDDVLATYVAGLGVTVHRGPLDDVMARFQGALAASGRVKTFLRLTGDCPLADPDVIDRVIAHHGEGGYDYTYNTADWTFPKGLDVEVIECAAFDKTCAAAATPYEHEHVTPYLYGHPQLFRIGEVRQSPPQRFRWTVDTPEDFAFVSAVYAALHPACPDFRMADVLAWQAHHPHLVLANPV
jgi:spore coat polysaccharide biosynthesis protein SpsF